MTRSNRKSRRLKQDPKLIGLGISILLATALMFLGCAAKGPATPTEPSDNPIGDMPFVTIMELSATMDPHSTSWSEILGKMAEGNIAASAIPEWTCRAYLLRGKNEQPGYGLYSYALLTSMPLDEKVFGRYLAFYDAFHGKFRELEGYAGIHNINKKTLNITFWPLALELFETIPSESNGRFFVTNYDYLMADMILSRIKDIQGEPGPFLIACRFPLGTGLEIPKEAEMLILNLSRISEELFGDVFTYFRKMVAAHPNTWGKKFDWDLIRIHICSAISLHGKPVLYAAQWVGEYFKIGKALAHP
jgi:hypothetical protein